MKRISPLAVALLSLPSISFAEEGVPSWAPKVDVVTRNHVVGYAPAKIVSDDSPARFVAREHAGVASEIRGRLAVDGNFARFILEPYTVVPNDRVRVNLGGIETTLLAYLTDDVLVGLYHHSSHNFSDGGLGFGIDLNAIVLDWTLVGPARLSQEGRSPLRLRFLGHWYWTGRASPYVFTPDTDVAASAIGSSRWRAGLEADGRAFTGRYDCALAVTGDGAPASSRLGCSATFPLGARFLGALGEHLRAGPFAGVGVNFSRTKEFGAATGYAGLRIDLVFADR